MDSLELLASTLKSYNSIEWLALSYYLGMGAYYGVVYLLSPTFRNHPSVNFGKTRDLKKKESLHISKNFFFIYYLGASLLSIMLLKLGFATPTSIRNTMFLFHAMRRLLETFAFPFSPSSKMHVWILVSGFFFYVSVVLILKETPAVNVGWIEVVVFFLAQLLQYVTISTTNRLRGPQMAHVPLGDMSLLFRYVLCPHFLAESIIYAALAQMAGWSLLSTVCFLFVATNQLLTGIFTREWYLKQFPKVKYRPKALIPLII